MEYVNGDTAVTIICKDHGKFQQKPVVHLQGSGCQKCSIIRRQPYDGPRDGELIVRIPLCNRKKEIVEHAIIDAVDFNLIKNFTWHLFAPKSQKYAVTSFNGVGIRMHHMILKVPEDNGVVDHIDNNGLNNTHENIREATRQQNSQNRKKKAGCSSQYYGVSLTKSKTWIAQCCGQNIGSFKYEINAARAYDDFVLELLGPDAKVNGIKKEDYILETDNLTKKITGKNADTAQTKPVKQADKLSDPSPRITKKIRQRRKKSQKDPQTPTIVRNDDGIAIIDTRDKHGNLNGTYLVDDNRYLDLIQYTWTKDDNGYATSGKLNLRMHQYIYGPVSSNRNVVDHINIDHRDNRIENLREATRSQNSHNQKKREGQSSTYIGVHMRPSGRWRAQMVCKGKRHSLGTYSTAEEAAKAYNVKAKELFGTSANLIRYPKSSRLSRRQSEFDLADVSNVTIDHYREIFTYSKGQLFGTILDLGE